jgi:hypothetical protein
MPIIRLGKIPVALRVSRSDGGSWPYLFQAIWR